MNKAARSGDHKLLEASDKILNLSDDNLNKPNNTADKTSKENQ